MKLSDYTNGLDSPVIIWLTGLPCSGKTTIAKALQQALLDTFDTVHHLDGDTFRARRSRGFSKAERQENIQEAFTYAVGLAQLYGPVVASFVSPYKDIRVWMKNRSPIPFVEVYVRCPVSVCEERDVKGMYAKARKGEIKNFTGIDDPYEEPEIPSIICDTEAETVAQSVDKIMTYITDMMRLLRTSH